MFYYARTQVGEKYSFSKRKSKTIVMQNLGAGVNKVHYGLCEDSEYR